MSNRGWEDSGNGEAVASTARQSGHTTDCSDADPFVHGSELANMHTPDPDTMGARSDLLEVPGQMSTT